MKTLIQHIEEKLIINQRFDEKLIINKNFKSGINLDELVDKEKSHLFKNVSLDSYRLNISSIHYTLKWSSLKDVVELDPEYVKKCLTDNNLYDKDCEAMYIPQIDYTYIKGIDTDMLEWYNEKQPATDKEKYDIYFAKTNKYFILRIVTVKTDITLDFIIVL